MEKLYTQQEAATMLGFEHPRSLNRLIEKGDLQCVKRTGRNGRKLFKISYLEEYIRRCES